MSDEAQVRTLLHDYARQAPTLDFGTDLWDRGRTHRKRARRYASVGVVIAATVLVVFGYAALDSNIRPNPLPAGPVNPTPSAVTRDIMQEPWFSTSADRLAWLQSPLPKVIDPDWDTAPPLSANPVDKAVAAYEQDVAGSGEPHISVLGDDGVWRQLDIGGPYRGALQPNSISPDQRRLAIPQDGAVVIVDLKEATAQRFPVAGSHWTVVWAPDGQTVLVGTEDSGGALLDVSDGSTVPVPFSSDNTTFLPDGSALEITKHSMVQVGQGSDLRTFVDNTATQSIRLQGIGAAPYVGPALVATEQSLALVRETVSNGDGPVRARGPLVVDIETGNPIAMIPFGESLSGETEGPLGWIDQDTVIFKIGGDVVAWTYITGELQRITETGPECCGDPTLALSMTALN